MSYDNNDSGFVKALAVGVIGVGLVVGAFWAWPTYNVWSSEMSGKARLAEAESSRRIAVLEAQAKQDSAKALAAAEVERAKGVAQANAIIGDSLKGNEAYLRYLWIQEIDKAKVVYVPTEAGLPILEAGRHLVPEAAAHK